MFKIGDIVEFSNKAYAYWEGSGRLYWFSDHVSHRTKLYNNAEEMRKFCRELQFKVKRITSELLFVSYLYENTEHTLSLSTWKFALLGSEHPEERTDPILARINRLYRKCKTTQHWTVNDKLCSEERAVS